MSSNPLVEVVFEVRFLPKSNFSTELLIAANQIFKDHQEIIQAEGLKFPDDLKEHQPDIFYIPSYKINYPSFSLLISDGSLVVLKNALDGEYEGWDTFKNIPVKILDILKLKDKIADIHRFSIKYTNVIQDNYSLKDLNISLKIGEEDLDESAKLTLKTEVKDGDFISLTDIASHVELQNIHEINGKTRILSGTLFVIDVINNTGINDLDNVDVEFLESLETLHDKANQIYTKIYNK